jgi:serine/threonine protein kinase
MSPEQLRAQKIDHRADLWSLGVIAYRAITGRRPFESRAMSDLIVQICSDPLPSVRDHDVEPADALDAFFARALARDPCLARRRSEWPPSSCSQGLRSPSAGTLPESCCRRTSSGHLVRRITQ